MTWDTVTAAGAAPVAKEPLVAGCAFLWGGGEFVIKFGRRSLEHFRGAVVEHDRCNLARGSGPHGKLKADRQAASN